MNTIPKDALHDFKEWGVWTGLGGCFITDVKLDVQPPVRAELCTDLGEKFPIFNGMLVRLAELARDEHRPVYLDVRRTEKARHRYVHTIHVLIAEHKSRPCVKCSTSSPQQPANQYSGVPFFECPSCHLQMYLGRVPRFKSELDVIA